MELPLIEARDGETAETKANGLLNPRSSRRGGVTRDARFCLLRCHQARFGGGGRGRKGENQGVERKGMRVVSMRWELLIRGREWKREEDREERVPPCPMEGGLTWN